ncbi:unnamed protein product [Acanthoscelides obtectus]|uniref:Exocyst complex component Sec10-like alpha-helical bundle domain-containing protein n=1 Tax=Acanthoscelides obtectus TaxID=200917 RepID=A0A9P0JR13_ACAOB|nr:unnamed protein product [Acanthoscelides obtectus]CAK1640244.1 Exocyst complex component 5 [Acanthoscelides obtectus]
MITSIGIQLNIDKGLIVFTMKRDKYMQSILAILRYIGRLFKCFLAPIFCLLHISVTDTRRNTQKYNDCLQKKKFVLEDTERKINTGLDRCLNAVTTWVKLYLQSEQKKSDFKPDTDDFDTVASPACKSVLNYVSGMIKEINTTLDGNNVSAVLQELGLRLHRVVYDHMLQFQYNTAGAMVAICDLNEYRSCCKQMGPLVTELFETLHALCNLLLVKPENLQQVCSEDSLVNLDKSVLHNFIQLRSDFKVQKQNIFLRS